MSQEKLEVNRPVFKICYLTVLVFFFSLLNPVEASDLPVPPFSIQWTRYLGGHIGQPLLCDSVVCFDTWPELRAIEFGAVEIKTGKILWKKHIEGYHTIMKTYENNRFFMVIERRGFDDILKDKLTYTGRVEVLVLDPVSGKELSRMPIDGVGCYPIIQDSTLYCVFGDDVLKSIDLFTQKTLWTITIPEAHRNVESFPPFKDVESSHSFLFRKHLKAAGAYLLVEDHNKTICVNRETGAVHWRYETGDEFWSINADDNGEHIYQSYKKELKSVNPMNGRQEWSVLMKSDIDWETLPYRGLIFLTCRGDGMLYALQADNGKVVWKYYLSDLKDPIITRPVFQDNTLVLTADRKLVAISLSGIKLWEFDTKETLLQDIVALKDGFLLHLTIGISRYIMETN